MWMWVWMLFELSCGEFEMWGYLRQSTSNKNDSSNNNNNIDHRTPNIRRIPSYKDFNPQSLKDVETLIDGNNYASNLDPIKEEQDQPDNVCLEAKRPSVFHRVSLAYQFTRALAGRPKADADEYVSLDSPNKAKEAADESVKTLGGTTQPDTCWLRPSVSDKPLKSAAGQRIKVPGGDKRVVVYTTSLRAVRSTFNDCHTVRSILQGFRVPVDERDLLMDSSFSDEIRKMMAQMGQGGRKVTLPRVFIGGRYIGGAEEVTELHETGELQKVLSGLPAVAPGICEICGGFRFILCNECNGSHKCHIEDGGFRTCIMCNENGLIRCPTCLSS